MFTTERWKYELAEFDRYFVEFSDDIGRIDKLARCLVYVAARTAHQNPADKKDIIQSTVDRLVLAEDQMGRTWLLSRLVEITTHALPL